MEASGIWEPYFKPTARVHSSGFRCFECGYLQIGAKNKAVKKVVIATRVDNIMNFEWSGRPQEIHLDLLKSGEIRIFNNVKRPYWSILGFPTLISRQLKKTPGLGMKILMKSGKSKRRRKDE